MAKGPKKYWPAWRYGPNGESQIFDRPEDVPAGWEDHPSKHAPEYKAQREAELKAAGKNAPPSPPSAPPAPPAKPSKEEKAAAKAAAAETHRLAKLAEAKAIWPNTPDDATTAELEANLEAHRNGTRK